MTCANAATAQPLNLLVAYPYITDRHIAIFRRLGARARLFIDSGAWTAWKSGKPIDLDAYCRFIEAMPVQPWRYFTLDVIGDNDATRRNHDTMLARGLAPVPIFTRGESPAELDRLYAHSDLVGFGGLLNGRASRQAYVHAALAHNGTRRAHLLGFTNMDHLKVLRPYSVDSSSWTGAGRYGVAAVYLGHGRFHMLRKYDVRTRPPQSILDAVARLGFDPGELARDARWHGRNSISWQISAASWIACAREVERNLGTMLFLAASPDSSINVLAEQFERMATQ